MIDYRSVIVLQDARAVRDNLAQELAKRGFAVRSCGSLAGFRHLYAMQPSPLVVLTGESDDLACDAQSARAAAPGAVIIALGTATDTAWRLHVMAAGADACHAASVDIGELAAILLSWARHAGARHGFEPVPGHGPDRALQHGHQHSHPHSLQHPHARALGHARAYAPESVRDAGAGGVYRPVDHMPSAPRAGPARTGMEYTLSGSGVSGSHRRTVPAESFSASSLERARRPAMQSSGHAPGHAYGQPVLRVSRLGSGWRLDAHCRVLACPRDRTLFVTAAENAFLMRISASEGQLLRRRRPASSADGAHGEPPAGELDPRSMDVLVSRLRRKARDAGIQLPLLAVRGCGYLFAESLTVTPSSLASRLPAPRRQTAQPPIPKSLLPTHKALRPSMQATLQPEPCAREFAFQLLAA